MRRVIFTADDFGLATPVNEAVSVAHRHGVLSTASLMVGAPAAEDAVRRARVLRTLHVGLHVVLVDGRPVLPPDEVPDLVETSGEFGRQLFRQGIRFFFLPRVRQQLEAEVRAQFQAFQATGLALDHVNAHNHMHLHPTVLNLIIHVGREYGLRAMRLPREPGLTRSLLLSPWTSLLRRRVRAAGLCCNDYLFGIESTGAMSEDKLLNIVDRLPNGTSEIYFHPATQASPDLKRRMPGYRHTEELAALLSPRVSAALASSGIERTCFSDIP